MRRQGGTFNEKDLQRMPRREQNRLRGTKYPSNGISGVDGRARYESILRWLDRHLFAVEEAPNPRTVQLIKERQTYLSWLVNGLVVQKVEAPADRLVGFWHVEAKKGTKNKRKRGSTVPEDDFTARMTRETFGGTGLLHASSFCVVSDLSDASMAGSSDSQNTL